VIVNQSPVQFLPLRGLASIQRPLAAAANTRNKDPTMKLCYKKEAHGCSIRGVNVRKSLKKPMT
jgi:hypothetical protein